ncbi:hypothetical protein GCM10023187_31540 [Nibrella viscosa]|uniref:Lipoprotein n=1 Tax=Nibrella viscosa TaxID=1084524 RepID=A0ABP8KKQ2_9BACT
MCKPNLLVSLLLLGSVVLFEGCQSTTDSLTPENSRTDANSRVIANVESIDVKLEGRPCYDGNCGGFEQSVAQTQATFPSYSILYIDPDGGPSEWYYSVTTESTDPYPTATSKNGKATKPSTKTITAGLGNVIVQLSTTAEVQANSECPTFSNVLRAYIIVEEQGQLYKRRIYNTSTEYEGPYFTAMFSNGAVSGSDGKGTQCNATGHFIKFENLPANIVGFTYVLDKRYYVDYSTNTIWIKTGRVGDSGKNVKCYEDTADGGPSCDFWPN